ncbi:MAG: Sensor protein [Myxococcaceae bacterium]|jgi:CheY-like chemotaxis protein|nr:Sensor protein [Myxococcaceae bacterium]
MQQFLHEEFALEIFDDGYAALDRVRKTPPAALITEIVVPQLDGLTLCRLLKSDPATQFVPILVVSMLASSERALKSGADAFLQKPLEKTRLLASLHGVTEGRDTK